MHRQELHGRGTVLGGANPGGHQGPPERGGEGAAAGHQHPAQVSPSSRHTTEHRERADLPLSGPRMCLLTWMHFSNSYSHQGKSVLGNWSEEV